MEIRYRYTGYNDANNCYYYDRRTNYNEQNTDSSIFFRYPNNGLLFQDYESQDLSVKDLYYILNNTQSKTTQKRVQMEINETKDIKKQINEPAKEKNSENSYKNATQNVSRTNPQHQSELDEQYKKLIFAKSSKERNIIKTNIIKIQEKKQKFLNAKREEEIHNLNNQVIGQDGFFEDTEYKYQLKTLYDKMAEAKTSSEANSANNKINSLNSRHKNDLNDKVKKNLIAEIGKISDYSPEKQSDLQSKLIRLTFAKTYTERNSLYNEAKDIQRQD